MGETLCAFACGKIRNEVEIMTVKTVWLVFALLALLTLLVIAIIANPYVINGMPFPSSWIITDDGKSAIRQYRLDKLKAVIKSPLLWLSALAAAVINISTIANAVKTAYDVLCG